MLSARLSSRTLWSMGWRYLVRRPWQTILMIIGITLGVSVAVAIDIANVSASRGFDLSVAAITGQTTHQIVGGPLGLDEDLYAGLRIRHHVRAAAPVVTDYVSSARLGERPLQLLGIDIFAEAPFRTYLTGGELSPETLSRFLTQPGALLVSAELADQYGITTGDPISLTVAGYERDAFIAGLIDVSESANRRALRGIVLSDIATTQELTGRTGKLDRIDLILPDDDNLLESISKALPPGIRLVSVDAGDNALDQMTAAFRTNLTALSLLALVVGMFLIYNTMTFSVVKRRPLLGTLRCLGTTKREIFILIIGEAFLIGLIGSVFGLGLGAGMGLGAVRLVSQTINDLYFVVTVQNISIPLISLLKGASLGILATVLAAAPPAWEAASVPPRAALSRSSLEDKAQQAIIRVAIFGAVALFIGLGLLSVPTRSLTVSFLGTFAIILSIAMLTPSITHLSMCLITPWFGRIGGPIGRMAPRNVSASLSRTAVAIAALMIAVSVTIGVSLMIGSFRYTLIDWLSQTIQGDIYISADTTAAAQAASPLDPRIIEIVQNEPDIARVDTLRSTVVDSALGPINVAAVTNPDYAKERMFISSEVPIAQIWNAMQRGSIIITEPLAQRFNLPADKDTITLYTANGPHDFPIIGVYRDYTSSQGTISMSVETYREWWEDDALTALALRLSPGVNPDQLAAELEDALIPIQKVFVRPNQALRREVLVIFDRTFAITRALQLLATAVAFIGILNAILSLQLDKQRQIGILRAVGLTAPQLWRLLLLETGLMGLVAGFLAMPTGVILSLILVYIINRRAFGWTLQMQIDWLPFLSALIISVAAALLAGVYPAYRIGNMIPVEALRNE